ncbi:SOUL-domain-containing protein [Gonapodya prolifera JEL478]|uniref:SOUL-domain-containing protein n=1 Tax=Gonapodya prolifera (strain JEL478) TaxID=1344416 RepID=A0A139ADK0_GONPJ|nr:SOUL-domain-containing protein [Gonapodya prolifera JEL478]|eukprot:KXS14664.1 SOUL-domain-containing protein [Gonapodya prolifera JEL478]
MNSVVTLARAHPIATSALIGAVIVVSFPDGRRFLSRFGKAMGAVGSIFGYEHVEQPDYKVIYTSPHGFEVRQYPQLIVAETTYEVVNGNYGGGFMTVAGYIFGKNKKRGGSEGEKVAMTAPVLMEPNSSEKIAMTAPVLMEPNSSEKIAMTAPVMMDGTTTSMTMSFIMPSKYKTVEDLPEPLDPRVKLKTQSPMTLAVLRRSGLLSTSLSQTMGSELLKALATDGKWEIDTFIRNGKVTTAGYNPPWALPWVRRNEAMVGVKEVAGGSASL